MAEQEVGKLVVKVGLDGTGFQEGISNINRQMKVVQAEFEAASAKIGKFGNSMDTQKLKTDLLNRQIELQRQKVAALTTAFEKSATIKGKDAKATQDLEIKLNKAKAQLYNFENELKKNNSTMQTATGHVHSMNKALDNTGHSAHQAHGGLGNMYKSVIQMSLVMGTLGAAALPVVGAFEAIKTAANFEEEMSNIKAISGSTAAEMVRFSDLAIKAGADTKYSATQAAQGIEELIKAGVSTEAILNGGLNGALNLATAGELDLAEAAEVASTALNAFRQDNLSVSDAANILAGAANASATTVQDLKYSLSMVSAIASSVGMTFEDTNAALAVFAQNGLKGSDAGTSLKTMLTNLQPQTDKQITLMQKLGLVTKDGSNAFFDAQGHLKSVADISDILQKSMKGLTDQQRLQAMETIFGSDAIRAANILFKEGAKGIKDMKSEMSKVTAEQVATEKMNNLKGSLEQLRGSVETVAIQIGQRLSPTLKGLTDKATDVVNKFGAWVKETDSIGEAFKRLENKEYDTAKSTRKLIEEYETLKAKANPTAEEQQRMNGLLNEIGRLMPNVITQYSKYGDILEIDTKKLAQNVETGEKHVTTLERIAKAIKDEVAPAYGVMGKLKFGGFGMEQVNAKTFEEAEAVVKHNLAVISDDIKNAETRWKELRFNSKEEYLEFLNRSYREELGSLKSFEEQRLEEIKKNTDEEYNRQVAHNELAKTTDDNYLANKEALEKAYRDRGLGSLKVAMAELESTTVIGIDNQAAQAEKHLMNLENKLRQGGEKVGSAWKEGFLNGISQGIYDALDEHLAIINNRLHGNSPPKEGPLKHIDEGGYNIAKAWVDGFLGVLNYANRAGTVLASAMAGGVGSTQKNWYANGGIFNRPSIIGVGEAGPGAVIPLSKAKGNTIINVYARTADIDEKALARIQRRAEMLAMI